MVCYVNNLPHEAAEQQLLQELLAGLGLAQPHGLAVALNDAVVPRAEWATCAVQPHDRLTIIRATQGG
ncbi:sulfur carrier protein ThiS [Hymenobacter nivis]|uniref:Thiamine biosynthesis protein ThiS n=1 Tax=Hymenobacter nivis TaxID=1850093 RepID=A0A2Z3GLT1_9BACT|nr:sulfur carrier protein ThiS [Hymenobacter nivis]AWM34198.1 thiamine biosynthesis protein ThiS [Hymenobacter nivis]